MAGSTGRAAASQLRTGCPLWAVPAKGYGTGRARCCDRSIGSEEPKLTDAAFNPNGCDAPRADIGHSGETRLPERAPGWCGLTPLTVHSLRGAFRVIRGELYARKVSVLVGFVEKIFFDPETSRRPTSVFERGELRKRRHLSSCAIHGAGRRIRLLHKKC